MGILQVRVILHLVVWVIVSLMAATHKSQESDVLSWCRMDSALSYEDTFGLPLLMISCEDKPLPLESIYGDTELADMKHHTSVYTLESCYFLSAPL